MNAPDRTPSLTERLKDQARHLGFVLAAACPAVTPAGYSRFLDWLARGYGGQMHYLADRAAAYEHPSGVLAGTRSVLMLAMPYRTDEPSDLRPGEGLVSRYAWGETDYHDLLHDRLRQLRAVLLDQVPHAAVRGIVDTAPLLERDFAQLAGLGWLGKNTLLLNKEHGSWLFLAALLTDQELDYDAPHEADHCGTCRLCLDACPTQAFPQPYVLDATRCISYLTIELRDPIPVELRAGMGDWLFGCDVCQNVCPWNRKAPAGEGEAFGPAVGMNPVSLGELFTLDDAAFRQRFRLTPLWRPRRRGLLRNAAIVLGNQRDARAVPALQRGLADDEPLVRGACAWALGQIGTAAARMALGQRQTAETDAVVQQEIAEALGRVES